MGTEKVKVAIFDNDGIIRTLKKYPINESGTKIKITEGGTNYWMPEFDKDSYLEMPTIKRFLFFGKQLYQRIYFVKRKGAKCVNFKTGTVHGPDPEELKEAVGKTMLNQLGQQKPPFPSWLLWFLAILNILTLAVVSGVIN